jgi:hypothetical protein
VSYLKTESRIVSNADPIPLADVCAHFPTLRQTLAHSSRSASYANVTTANALATLESEGFRVHSVATAKVKLPDKHGFEKHKITLRHVNATPHRGVVPEVQLINSHDGTSAFVLYAGWLRFACENGLVAGDSVHAIKLYHRGKSLADQTGEAAHRIAAMQSDLVGIVDSWSQRQLTEDEIAQFACEVQDLRFPNWATTGAPITSHGMLAAITHVRRPEDHGNDLWTVYNRAQEAVIRGGMQGRIIGSNGRPRKTTVRGIKAIDSELRANRGLFDIARKFATDAELVAA